MKKKVFYAQVLGILRNYDMDKWEAKAVAKRALECRKLDREWFISDLIDHFKR